MRNGVFKKKFSPEKLLIPAIAAVLAMVTGCLLIMLMGKDPLVALGALFQGAFSDWASFAEIFINMTPMICTALAYAVANKCGLINIGADGQLYIGGLFGMMAALYLKGLPACLHIPVCILAGCFGGALWGMVAGLLKTRFGINEIISTIMLNYIGKYFVNFMVSRVIREPGGTKPQTAIIGQSAVIGRLFAGNRLHWGILLAVLALLIFYFYLWHTRSGYQTRVVGLNPNAAKYAGMKCGKQIVIAMALAGTFAGLGGTIELLGIHQRLYLNFSSGMGFDGITVALVGQNTPSGIFLSAFLFGSFKAGSSLMQMVSNVPSAMVEIIQTLVIIFVVCSQYVVQKRSRQRMITLARKESASL